MGDGRRSLKPVFVLVFRLCFASLFQSMDVDARFVGVEELVADLRSQDIDRIDKSLNDVKRMSYQGQVLPFILDLWEMKQDNHPDLPWGLIASDIIRVEVANILLQASNNHRIDLDQKALHQYVSALVDSKDIAVAAKAIGTLALTDDPQDVPKILAVAKSIRGGNFHIAVIALTNMCNRDAATAVEDLEKHVTDKELQGFIVETKRKSEEFKNKTDRCRQVRRK